MQGSNPDEPENVTTEYSLVSRRPNTNGFGGITDLEIGPDGYMYVLSSEDDGAILYKISKAS
jgi:glucose/arabinose dehydrogenase